ncbi:MAG: iron-containing alcohol dehydrogenase [Candidatus Jordarchaeales archaeon]
MTWKPYEYGTRMLYTLLGAKPMRSLVGYFLCPRILIGKLGLVIGLSIGAAMLEKKRAFIITDKAIRNLAESLIPYFEMVQFTVKICDKAVPEPPIPVVREIVEEMREFEPDLIVAVGGGSAIDTAKAAWILYERPDIDFSMVEALTPLGLRKKAYLAAVPTTAGTGSEATQAFVLTDVSQTPPRKLAAQHPECVPEFAILLPELTVGMPPELTVGTGLDALAHAVDAYINRNWGSDLTDPMALKAIELIIRYLPIVYKQPRNMNAREKMLIAATMAGLAFGNAGTAITHALGHSFGKVFNIHHGRAVGMFIPYSLRFEAKVTDGYVGLAKWLNFSLDLDVVGKTKEKTLEKLTQFFKEFITGLGVPIAIKDLGISRSEFEEKKEVLVKYAYEDPTAIFSTRPASIDDFRKLFDYAYEGKDVDW